MRNIYYTAKTGKRTASGHTITRGSVYIIKRGCNTTPHGCDALENIGEYVHSSGGAGIESAILTALQIAKIDNGGGYYSHWRDSVNLIEI